MYTIKLKNNKEFHCDSNQTIFDAAKAAGITLEHSCLSARCRSCRSRVISGTSESVHEESVLTEEERKSGYILSCNSMPNSNMELDLTDITDLLIYPTKTVPSKIESIEKLNETVIKLVLRIPPSIDFKFLAGQYVNLSINGIKRSYSIASSALKLNKLEFYIKNYNGGIMSEYFFINAKTDDLLRMEGPLGTFFYRETDYQNIIFLATGTGMAPVKSILDNFEDNADLLKNKIVWFFWGNRDNSDIFWKPDYQKFKVNFVPVLSRATTEWSGEIGYIQDALVKRVDIDLKNSVFYACGSNKMIDETFKLLKNYGVNDDAFHSDAFVSTN